METRARLEKTSPQNNIGKYALYVLFVLLCIALAIVKPSFRTLDNMTNVLRQISITGYMAIGMLMVIITGGIDLAAGVTVGLCGAIGASFAQVGGSPIIGIFVGLAVGALVGALNGFLVAGLNMPPFIATLGTKMILNGVALVYTEGRPVTNLSKEFTNIGGGYIGGIPIPVWILLACVLIGIFILRYTKYGRYLYAIGGNELSARVSGVNVRMVKWTVYIINGLFSALCGLVLAARVNAGSPVAGTNYETDAITICVLGGASLSGGVGSIGGAVAGMLFIGVVTNGMNLLNISSYWQLIVKGIIIVAAIVLDMYSKKAK